ncbi:hypothetical protein [Bacillus massiliglaciei]|nr:hypothetical protein [Bacillus massiliglaciei]
MHAIEIAMQESLQYVWLAIIILLIIQFGGKTPNGRDGFLRYVFRHFGRP